MSSLKFAMLFLSIWSLLIWMAHKNSASDTKLDEIELDSNVQTSLPKPTHDYPDSNQRMVLVDEEDDEVRITNVVEDGHPALETDSVAESSLKYATHLERDEIELAGEIAAARKRGYTPPQPEKITSEDEARLRRLGVDLSQPSLSASENLDGWHPGLGDPDTVADDSDVAVESVINTNPVPERRPFFVPPEDPPD